MFLHIDPSNGLAIYDQVVRQVKYAVARGAIKPGNLVPSVRELARELTLNPNTVARAYQQLQTDGVLVSVRGMGLEVAPDAVAPCQHLRRELIRERLRQVLHEAFHGGLSTEEVQQLVQQELTATSKAGDAS